MIRIIAIAIIIACLLMVAPARAATLKIGECTSCDSSNTIDTMLFEGDPEFNYGAFVTWQTGWATDINTEIRSIIAFLLTQPELTGATITAATFGCFVGTVFTGGNTTIEIHEIATANLAWVEGTKNGTAAGAGEPDWNHRSHSGTPWAGSGGLSTVTTDYVSASYGSFNGTTTGAKTATLSAAAITYLNSVIGVRARFLIFTSDSFVNGERSRMISAEGATAANRPFLELTYTPAGGEAGAQRLIMIRR